MRRASAQPHLRQLRRRVVSEKLLKLDGIRGAALEVRSYHAAPGPALQFTVENIGYAQLRPEEVKELMTRLAAWLREIGQAVDRCAEMAYVDGNVRICTFQAGHGGKHYFLGEATANRCPDCGTTTGVHFNYCTRAESAR